MTNPLDLLLPVTPPTPDRHVYGTVTATNPLRVRLDSDSVSLPVAPTTLATLANGDRVLVLVKGLQRIILGRVGGGLPDTGWQACTLVGDVLEVAPVQVRRIGQTVHIRGQVRRVGGWPSGLTALANLPAGFAPTTYSQAVSVLTYDGGAVTVRVVPGGTLQLYAGPGTPTSQPILGGSWLLG